MTSVCKLCLTSVAIFHHCDILVTYKTETLSSKLALRSREIFKETFILEFFIEVS